MDDKEWRDIVLNKVEKIEEGQASVLEMLHLHILDSEKQNSLIRQEHLSLKEKVHFLWGAIIFVTGTVLTAFIGKKF